MKPAGAVPLAVVPLSLEEANEAVRRWHRHHRAVLGGKFAVGVAREGGMADPGPHICGGLIAGRPIARAEDDGWTLEVTRVATDGTPNATSMLYAAATRAAFALGYRRVITRTRADESGSSLKGAGWRVVGQRRARSWQADSPGRPRLDKTEPFQRLLWEATA